MPGCLHVLVSLSTTKEPLAGHPLLKVALALIVQFTSSSSVEEGLMHTVDRKSEPVSTLVQLES